MLAAKWRQIVFGMKTPSVTGAYPLAPAKADPAYRGRVTVETAHCVGCGGCAVVCPSRCIRITDLDMTTRIIRRHLDRCLGCGRCEDACAYDAIHMVPDWESATPDRRDLLIEQRLFMGVCDRCGRCYEPAHPLDRADVTGMMADEPELRASTDGHADPAHETVPVMGGTREA
ncbi:MAG: 4Fe-4S dicluster domain-containing protein [Candidatus Eisenbacteria bacterium]